LASARDEVDTEPCAISASFGEDRPRATRAEGPLLVPGHNCWRIERAERLAFLVDGEQYFGAVRSALTKAQRSIFILGWDIDSRMRLVPEGANDGFPDPLGEFLNELVARRSDLHGYVLSWDFAMLYAMEREWLPIYKLDWRTHRRLTFRLDDRHPVGASHHQKVVVIDDSVAFVSGYDLTRCRFDSSEHKCDDPRRVDHRGVPYPPFHDVGVVVSGDCARALGELARDRWQRATDETVETSTDHVDRSATFDAWPDGVEPEAHNIDVAIARTEPAYQGRVGVAEIRALHLDAINAARRHVFAENQYFTSRTIADAFAARLAKDDAPEIGVISPYMQSGWLEISTMGVLRARIHAQLRAADHHDRYRLYCPTLDWLQSDASCLNVHSKVFVVDDALLTVGSSNLSDRSMAIDTECNLAIEAGGDPQKTALIASLRNRLLAEHLGCETEDVRDAIEREGGLHAAIASLRHAGHRSLNAIEPVADPALEAIVPDRHVFDPEQPLDPDLIVADLVPHEEARSGTVTRLIGIATGIVVLAALAAAWRFTPLREWLAFDRLIEMGVALREYDWAPMAVLLAFVAGGLVAFPLLVLIAATALVFGPIVGPIYALLGALISAAATFAIGRKLGRETVRTLAGQRVNDLSKRLARRGLIAVAFVRMLPVAPFSVVNVVAGASHIRWSDFLLGTTIGLLPGIVTMTFFVDRAIAAVQHPGPGTFVLLFLAVALIFALVWTLRRKLAGRNDDDGTQPSQLAHGS
jgi:phosphatidylserine/phosphatidylglycerophosphate/cardiolipin synthase-like enzyme/uncharacterized membrane protein YdjX (TVP38/TMEM64 family)